MTPNRDEIIRMAQEAGLLTEDEVWVSPHQEAMERFAGLVAAQEREACAMEAEYEAARWPYAPEIREPCKEIAKEIRARGQS